MHQHLPDAEPTGLLIDAAMKLIFPWIPEFSVDERREALLRASNLALMKGVTTVVDVGRYFPGQSVQLSWDDFSGWNQKYDSGLLGCYGKHHCFTVWMPLEHAIHVTRIYCLILYMLSAELIYPRKYFKKLNGFS